MPPPPIPGINPIMPPLMLPPPMLPPIFPPMLPPPMLTTPCMPPPLIPAPIAPLIPLPSPTPVVPIDPLQMLPKPEQLEKPPAMPVLAAPKPSAGPLVPSPLNFARRSPREDFAGPPVGPPPNPEGAELLPPKPRGALCPPPPLHAGTAPLSTDGRAPKPMLRGASCKELCTITPPGPPDKGAAALLPRELPKEAPGIEAAARVSAACEARSCTTKPAEEEELDGLKDPPGGLAGCLGGGVGRRCGMSSCRRLPMR